MTTQVRFRRGTKAEHETFTGAFSEVTVVSDDIALRVHDGDTPGGHPVLMRSDLGADNGAASLDEEGQVPASQLGNVAEAIGDITDPANGIDSNKLKFQNLGLPAVPRSVGDKLRDYCYIEDYGGGVAISAAGNVTAFNNAQTQLKTQSTRGGHLLLRSGIYQQASAFTLLSDVTLEGQGADNTVLKPTFTAGDSVQIGNGVDLVQHANARGFSIEPAALMTSGALVRFRNHFFCEAENIRMPSNAFWNVAIDNGAVSYIARLRDIFTNSGQFGLIVGEQGTGDVQNVFVEDCHFNLATAAGIRLTNVGGIMIDKSECLQCNVSLLTYPGAGQRVFAMQIGDVYLDTPALAALQLYTNGGKVSDSVFVGTWFSSAGGDGTAGSPNVVISGATADAIRGISFVGCTITNARGEGVIVNNSSGVNFEGCKVTSNGMDDYFTPGTVHPGILIQAGAQNVRINGGISGIAGGFTFNKQSYGIVVNAGATGVVINGVDVRQNATGGIADQAAGTKIVNCPGAVTSTHGAVLINPGDAAKVVTHDLGFTPTFADIMLSPQGIYAAAGLTGAYVSAVTATDFTITLSGAATAAINICWSARVKGA